MCAHEEPHFKIWQEKKVINQTLLSKQVDDRFDFAFCPEVTEGYHFIAEKLLNTQFSSCYICGGSSRTRYKFVAGLIIQEHFRETPCL